MKNKILAVTLVAFACSIALNAMAMNMETDLKAMAKDAGLEVAQENTPIAPKEVDEKADAQQNGPVSESEQDTSYFSQLKGMYEKGSLPTTKELKGWFAGRCYWGNYPDRAAGGILMGVRKKRTKQNGPLFPPYEFKLMTFYDTSDNPDIYDNMTDKDKCEMAEMADPLFSGHELVKEIDASLMTRSLDPEAIAEFRVRKYEDYFVEIGIALKDVQGIKTGEIFMACYYFKKVRN
ncbi:hypothetical protein ACFL6Y_02220 [Elusimicrobiota bacterium]